MLDVFYDAYLVLSKVYSDGAFIDKAITETNIEPSNKPKTVKICYGVLDKDIYLDYCIDALCIKKPKQKIRILLKLLMTRAKRYYAIYYLLLTQKRLRKAI